MIKNRNYVKSQFLFFYFVIQFINLFLLSTKLYADAELAQQMSLLHPSLLVKH